jgi:hypothetical protein
MLWGVAFRGSVEFSNFELFFVLFLICHFSCFLFALRFLLLLDDFFELLLTFCSSNYASWGLGFKLQTLCLLLSIDLLRGRLRTPNEQFLGLIMMSHCLVKI